MSYFIIFGLRHFLIRSFTAHQLGIYDDEYKNYRFEKRQQYFHIFFIPVLSLGSVWRVRKPDNKLYHVPESLQSKLKNVARGKWWRLFAANLGIEMILFFGICYMAIDVAEYYYTVERRKERFPEEIAEIEAVINNPTTEDFFDMTIYTSNSPGNWNYLRRGYYKIDSITETQLLLGSSDSSIFHTANIIEHYDTTRSTIWVDRMQLKNTIDRKFDDYAIHSSIWWEIMYTFNLTPKHHKFYGSQVENFDKSYSIHVEDVRKKD